MWTSVIVIDNINKVDFITIKTNYYRILARYTCTVNKIRKSFCKLVKNLKIPEFQNKTNIRLDSRPSLFNHLDYLVTFYQLHTITNFVRFQNYYIRIVSLYI
jgi:hypothetical protein